MVLIVSRKGYLAPPHQAPQWLLIASLFLLPMVYYEWRRRRHRSHGAPPSIDGALREKMA